MKLCVCVGVEPLPPSTPPWNEKHPFIFISSLKSMVVAPLPADTGRHATTYSQSIRTPLHLTHTPCAHTWLNNPFPYSQFHKIKYPHIVLLLEGHSCSEVNQLGLPKFSEQSTVGAWIPNIGVPTHWITKCFEVGICNGLVLEWYSYGPDHSKTEPL